MSPAEPRRTTAIVGRPSGSVLCPPSDQRLFRGADGQAWVVCERLAPREPWVRAPSYLIFESGPVARRVWHFPPDWATLDDAALDRLKDAR